jgi:hypothetical protein
MTKTARLCLLVLIAILTQDTAVAKSALEQQAERRCLPEPRAVASKVTPIPSSRRFA